MVPADEVRLAQHFVYCHFLFCLARAPFALVDLFECYTHAALAMGCCKFDEVNKSSNQ